MSTVRRVSVLAAASIVAALLAACEPLPPRPSFVVNTTQDLDDAAPGDGLCETEVGTGECSLRAAIQEGNASGVADVALPGGTYLDPFGDNMVITGEIHITGPGLDEAVDLRNRLYVAEGGVLVLNDFAALSDSQVVVDGVFLGRNIHLAAGEWHVVDVRPTGTAVVDNAVLVGLVYSPVRNAGSLHVRHSLLLADEVPPEFPPGGDSALYTTGDGTSSIWSSILHSENGLVCTGTPPSSRGYNVTNVPAEIYDGCSLTGPGDVRGVDVQTTRLGSGSATPFAYTIDVASPLVDAIPMGTNGCGTGVLADLFGAPRPVDGDGDGVAGCDIGPIERPAP